ncbi:hypothetical protein GCM10009609_20930 [Pseudonocardia aurantiaca]
MRPAPMRGPVRAVGDIMEARMEARMENPAMVLPGASTPFTVR